MLYTGHIKPFAEASELFMHAMFQLFILHGMASFRGQKVGSWRVLNQVCREEEDLIHLPVWTNPSNSLFEFL
jgi:hypothetical protein